MNQEPQDPPPGWHPIAFFRRKWDGFFLEPNDESEFPESVGELETKLKTEEPSLAAAILAEAEAIHDDLARRVSNAERRATTLQGAAAIAAGLTLTGAGLLVDTKIDGTAWKVAFGVILVVLTLSLVLCAYRATLASTRVFGWTTTDSRAILKRTRGTVPAAQTARAADLLKAVGDNARFARYKVAMMRAAAEWLTRALPALVVFAGAALLYAAVGPTKERSLPAKPAAQQKTTSPPGQHHGGKPAGPNGRPPAPKDR